MKNFFVLLACVLSVTSFGQPTGGIRAGVNLSNSNVSQGPLDYNSDSRTSFHAGGYLVMKMGGKFTFEPEVIVNLVGGSITDVSVFDDGYTIETTTTVIEWKPAYVSIPAMVGFNITKRLSVTAGIQLGLLAGGKSEVTQDVDGAVTKTDADAKDILKSTDFSTNFGLKFNIIKKLNISARYCVGLSNNYNKDFIFNFTDEIKTSNLQFTLEYQLFGKSGAK